MKYAIEPIEIAPKIWLGADGEGEWRLFCESCKLEDEWHLNGVAQYVLNLATLVLKSGEMVEAVLSGRLGGMALNTEDFNDVAVRKLIDRANELWTFEVEK